MNLDDHRHSRTMIQTFSTGSRRLAPLTARGPGAGRACALSPPRSSPAGARAARIASSRLQ